MRGAGCSNAVLRNLGFQLQFRGAPQHDYVLSERFSTIGIEKLLALG